MDLHNHLRDRSKSDFDSVELQTEIENIKPSLIIGLDISSPKSIFNIFLTMNSKIVCFRILWVTLRMLLTIPITVTSGEWSLSKLQLIKTYLRSTMANDHFVSLSILFIENEVTATIEFSMFIKNFTRKISRKCKNVILNYI